MSNLAEKIGKVFHRDGWLNAITGLGVKGKDKRIGAYAAYQKMDEVTVS